MTTAAIDVRALEPAAEGRAGAPAAAAKPGFLARLTAAAAASRQRRAERVIAGFIQRRGGRMTDELEREIGNRFTSLD
jgi:hypothetical protein